MDDQDTQFYDRQGKPITQSDACDLIAQNLDHVARTAITDTADPKKSYIVSTIWLGVDIELGDYPRPMIFETVVFDRNHRCVDRVPSATEEHAMQAHRTMVDEYTRNMVDAVIVDLSDMEH